MSYNVPDLSYLMTPHNTGPEVVFSSNREPNDNKDRNSATENTWRCKSMAEEDKEMYMRYWKNVRKARRRRDYKDAYSWLELMRKLKQFRETTVEERFPPVYSKCHKAILRFIPKYTYKQIADMAGCARSAIGNLARNNWWDVSEEYVQEIYDNLVRARV